MTSRWGIASSSISIASAAGLSRRKHMMSRQLTPSSVSPSRSARVMPPTTSSNGTPLGTWLWGSKNTSTCRAPSAATRRT